jgi:hypothetical protein
MMDNLLLLLLILLSVAVVGTWLFGRYLVGRIGARLSEEQTAMPPEWQGVIAAGPERFGNPRDITGLFLALPFTFFFAALQITSLLKLQLDWHAQRQELDLWEVYGAMGSCLSLPFALAGAVLVVKGGSAPTHAIGAACLWDTGSVVARPYRRNVLLRHPSDDLSECRQSRGQTVVGKPRWAERRLHR